MTLSALTSSEAVRAALAEYDQLGGAEFLRRYGFGPAESYVLFYDGRAYPSKAIAGVAVGKQHLDRGPLRASEFSGGNNTVRAKLEELGFVVRETTADPTGQEAPETRSYWFVGAAFGRRDDQVERFLREGVWEISTPSDAEAAQVRSMQPGERIAIKASFVQKHNLPFDGRGNSVSVMRIKARGVITANPGDGERVEVEWDPEFSARDWYFYTYRATIWQLSAGHHLADRLIAFTFDDQSQDLDWFRNQTGWAAQFGDNAQVRSRRFWIEKTIANGRADRLSGEHALGRALWSPQRKRGVRTAVYAAWAVG